MMIMNKWLYELMALSCLVVLNACEPDTPIDVPLPAEGFRYDDIDSSVYPEGPRVASRIYYPYNIKNLSNIGATTVTSGKGGRMESVRWLGETVASEGMVACIVDAQDNKSTAGYEVAQRTALGILQEENANPNSPLYNKLGRYGLIGYSLGGAAAINVGSSLGIQVKIIVGLAPYYGNPTANLNAATMILAGTNDRVSKPSITRNTFEQLPTEIPRFYAEVVGKNHFFWARYRDQSMVDDLIVAWLKYYLESDKSYLSTIENPGLQYSNYKYHP